MGTNNENDTKSNQLVTKKILRGILYVVGGVILIGIVFLCFPPASCKDPNRANSILTFFITAAACLVGGIILGFLFSIPRYKKDQNNNSSTDSQRLSYYKDNTNLEEISDWLTKIIVGVSLIQFNHILDKLDTTAKNLSFAFYCPCQSSSQYYAFAYASILFFLFTGFGVGYIWTRIVFTWMLFNNQKEMDEDNKKVSPAGAALVQKEISEQSNAFSGPEIKNQDFPENVSQESKDSLQRLQTKVKEILKTKTTYVDQDLQKGRWGGKSQVNGRKITATVTTSDVEGYYTIHFLIESMQGTQLPPAALLVHDSYEFPDDAIYLKPNEDGKIRLELLGYEAFTVGVVFEDGTELELDLNNVTGFPKDFYWGKNK
jgi:hypothetical protein